jgi:hypothetical protein
MEPYTLPWQFSPIRSPAQAVEAVAGYMDHEARFVLYEYGTVLLLKPELDRPEVVDGAMREARFKTDFRVMHMKDGNFLVWLASPLCVFVSAEDASSALASLEQDPSPTLYPGETFLGGSNRRDYIIGLAGRARAHKDSLKQNQVARYVPPAA